MDTLVAAIKAAGGTVEVVRIHERAPNTEAILRVHIDGLVMTMFVVCGKSRVAATVHATTDASLAAMMPLWT